MRRRESSSAGRSASSSSTVGGSLKGNRAVTNSILSECHKVQRNARELKAPCNKDIREIKTTDTCLRSFLRNLQIFSIWFTVVHGGESLPVETNRVLRNPIDLLLSFFGSNEDL